MPSGKIHAGITVATAGLTYTIGTKSGDPPEYAVATALGCIIGIILTPDLDIKGTEADRVVRESAGLIPALVWGILWNPYSALIPHRSILSHGLIIGTLIRLLYIAVPLALLGILPKPGPIISRMILGLVMSDNMHIGADFLISGLKDIVERKKKEWTNEIHKKIY